MTGDDLAGLEAAAKAATPGPWWANALYPHGDVTTPDGEVISHSRYVESAGGTVCSTGNRTRDVEYIAAAHPQAVLALVEEVRLLRVKVHVLERRYPGGAE